MHLLPQPRGPRTAPGSFLTSDCRGNLKRIQAEFEGRTGMHLRAGMEPEMMWLKMKDDGTPDVAGVTKPYCYHIDQFSELQPIIHKVIEYGQKMGLDMIQGDHEDAPGQIELNFNFDRAEQHRRQPVDLPPGVQAGRPRAERVPVLHAEAVHGRVGQRLPHQHLALEGRREPVHARTRDDPRLPSKLGVQSIGGILEHLSALTAVTASTVNSYRRLWDTGFWAPVFADWGFQNRTTALRVSAPGRFEYRSVDSAVNPYLCLAALIKVMDDGITRGSTRARPRSATSTRRWRAARRSRSCP